MDRKDLLVPLEFKAPQVLLDLPDLRVRKAIKEIRVLWDLQARLDPLVLLELKVPQVLLDLPVQQEQQARQVHKEHRALRGPLDPLDPPARPVHKDLQATEVPLPAKSLLWNSLQLQTWPAAHARKDSGKRVHSTPCPTRTASASHW